MLRVLTPSPSPCYAFSFFWQNSFPDLENQGLLIQSLSNKFSFCPCSLKSFPCIPGGRALLFPSSPRVFTSEAPGVAAPPSPGVRHSPPLLLLLPLDLALPFTARGALQPSRKSLCVCLSFLLPLGELIRLTQEVFCFSFFFFKLGWIFYLSSLC